MTFKNATSIATVSLSGALREKLTVIAAAGFQGIELHENDLLDFEGGPEQVRDMVHDLGLEILLFQPFRDFEGMSRELLKINLERAKQKFDVMNRLGVDTILVCSNVQPNTSLDDNVIIEDLNLLAEHAAVHGVKIGYEALSWGTHVRSYQHVWKIVKAVGHASLGVILDSFHTLAIKDNLSALSTIPAEKIFFVQLADAPQLSLPFLEWSRHHRCYPGQGDFDVPEFVRKILKTGYSGPLSLEIFNDRLKTLPPKPLAFEGARSMEYLAEKIIIDQRDASRTKIYQDLLSQNRYHSIDVSESTRRSQNQQRG